MKTPSSVVRRLCTLSASKLGERKSFKKIEVINFALKICQYSSPTPKTMAFVLIRGDINPWVLFTIYSAENTNLSVSPRNGPFINKSCLEFVKGGLTGWLLASDIQISK